MRALSTALVIAIVGAVANRAQAQYQTQPAPRQQAPIAQSSYVYNSYFQGSEERGVMPAAPQSQYGFTDNHQTIPAGHGTCCEHADSCDACDSCDEDSCDDGCGADDEPWRLFGCFTPLGTKFYGWMSQGLAWNWDSPADRFNGPVTWPDRSNEWNIYETYMIAERTTDTEGYGFDMGFRVDTLWGTNSRFCTSAGLEDRINKSQSFYGLAFPNMYLETAYNNWKTKWGHFVSPVGYFAIGTYNNFFNVLPYTFQYGEPFTHTGFLTTYTVSDNLSLSGGLTRGWDNSTNFNPNLGVIGLVTYTGPQEGIWNYFVSWSNEPNFGPARSNGLPGVSPRYLQTLVWQYNLTERLQYVAQTDLGVQSRALADGRIAHWYGFNQFLFYNTSDSVAWGGNFEWFRDEEGYRVGGFLPNFTNNTVGGPTETRGLPTDRSGYAGNFFRAMIGPKWTVNKNLIIRPALVFDWYTGAINNPDGLKPYDDGTSNNQQMLATDMILLF